MRTFLKAMVCFAAMAACTAYGVDTTKSGDIASGSIWSGGSVPTSSIAGFNVSAGTYTLSRDVTLGSVSIKQSCNFNLNTSGNHKITTSKVYLGWYNRTININGGVWDLSGSLSSDAGATDHTFSIANANGTAHTIDVTLANGCIVTNANDIRVGHGTNKNKLKITDGSRIYTKGSSSLWVNYNCVNGLLKMDSGGQLYVEGALYDGYANVAKLADTTNKIVVTGSGSKLSATRFTVGSAFGRNSLRVSDGGEMSAPEKFIVGNSANANTNQAVFETGATFTMRDIRVGENGSCGNALEFRSGASGLIDAGGRIGGWTTASSGNTILVSNATVSATGVLGFGAPSGDASGISGNGLIIQGATPLLSNTSSIQVKNRSFLRIEVPAGGYANDVTPISASSVTFDNTSTFNIVLPDMEGMPDSQRLISTTGGVTIPDAVLESAMASVAQQSGGNLRLVKADGGKAIDLKVVKGMIIMFK